MISDVGIILAGGEGSRFKLDNEKIFTKIKGRTLIDYAISKLKKLNLKINIVIKKRLKENLSRRKVKFHIQKKSMGTGHAIQVFLKSKPKFNYCLVMNSDTPFIHLKDLKRVLSFKNKVDLVVLSYKNQKNLSNGVFLKDKLGKYFIKEYKMLNKKEKKTSICFSGIMFFNKRISKEFLRIKKNKKKNEYLITDIFKVISNKKFTTKIVQAKFPNLCFGINTIEDLKIVKKKLKL